MSNFRSHSAVHDVLHIRELVDFICNSLFIYDLPSLMLASRSTLFLVAPHIWRTVDVKRILNLIVERPDSVSEGANVDEESLCTSFDFTRYELYAPFIKEIHFGYSDYRSLDSRRVRAFILRARQGTSLSSLATVIFTRIAVIEPSWLDNLLVPTLERLVISDTHYDSSIITNTLWEKLIANTPTIKALEFYPMDLTEYARRDRLIDVCQLSSSNFHPQPLSQLRTITSWIGIFANNGLSILSSLPRLRKLTIYERDKEVITSPLLASSDSFPALVELAVYASYHQNRRHPEHFTLELPNFLARTPRLESLTVWTKDFSLASALGIMSKLPLKHVWLQLCHFHSVDVADEIVASLPQLVTLKISYDVVYQAGQDMPKASELVARQSIWGTLARCDRTCLRTGRN